MQQTGSRRIESYDLIRSFSILSVFFGHILGKQLVHPFPLSLVRTLSPGLTMSLLGFISGALLSRSRSEAGPFLVRRGTRIYVSLFLCVGFVLVIHAMMGKDVVNQHTLLHLFGLSGFFSIFQVTNRSTVGRGLWFVTAIVAMYLVMPLLRVAFRHRNGLAHFALLVVGCTVLQFVTYGTESLWNVVISFSLGLYLGTTGKLSSVHRIDRPFVALLFAGVVFLTCWLATVRLLPYPVRSLLFVFYPLAFVPCFCVLTEKLPASLMKAVVLFSGLSYEFYILHFYIINDRFYEFFPTSFGLVAQIIIAFALTLIVSLVLSRLAARIRRRLDDYLLPTTS